MTDRILRLSRLMKLSWEIQRTKHRKNRSKSLAAAWAIVNNEHIAVQYLTRKLNRDKPLHPRVERQYGLFNQ